jgi:hypothetical protein
MTPPYAICDTKGQLVRIVAEVPTNTEEGFSYISVTEAQAKELRRRLNQGEKLVRDYAVVDSYKR